MVAVMSFRKRHPSQHKLRTFAVSRLCRLQVLGLTLTVLDRNATIRFRGWGGNAVDQGVKALLKSGELSENSRRIHSELESRCVQGRSSTAARRSEECGRGNGRCTDDSAISHSRSVVRIWHAELTNLRRVRRIAGCPPIRL